MTLEEIKSLCRERGLRLTALGAAAWRVQGRGLDLRFSDPRSVRSEDLNPPELRPGAYDSARDDARFRFRDS